MTDVGHDNAWEERWQEGRTGWDQSKSHLSLTSLLRSSLVDQLGIPRSGRALVPGCGTGYDVHTFASIGLDAVGMDLAPIGVEKAKMWLSQQAVTEGTAEVVCGDFFEYKTEDKYDLIYDYTFLCAIPPDLHVRWASQMRDLSASNASLITLMYPLPPTDNNPPPWPLTVEKYHQLLDTDWEIIWEKDVPVEERRTSGAKGGERIAVWKRK
ncbi:uncharacterized protein I303_100026 [Kwoniella dejecticola CBS 10117]|uniref:Thiol methyltransferase 1 n=1 Tax=Kwoniella dejecticola CBS 10117 TaxID=1296121 RepID=A0A1A6ADS4_9TREE|nr:uncharacterized protein I303_00026 [Kwoniella dejecticola CBS 10117]OBR88215.1 hypothetical protein I303_00026 [Kwoniella dejecticola CBS 10117]